MDLISITSAISIPQESFNRYGPISGKTLSNENNTTPIACNCYRPRVLLLTDEAASLDSVKKISPSNGD